jgi:signal transduction histidine kinase
MEINMKHSVYYKFLLGYILFALLSILVINVFSSKRLNNSLYEDAARSLYDAGNTIIKRDFKDDFSEFLSNPEISKDLQSLSSIMNCRLWIIDTSDRIIYDTNAIRLNSFLPDFDITDFGNSYYMIGDFYGSFSNETLSVAIPIVGDFQTEGYMILHHETDTIRNSSKKILNVVFWTFFVVFDLSLIILVIFTIVIYLPLRKISYATREFAKGNLTYEGLSSFTNEDEIGSLGVSLNYMAKKLNNIEDDEKKFISNVSHDFRSPLTSIKGYVEAIKDGTIPPEAQGKYLDIVLFETERLTKLTQSLLNLNEWDNNANRLFLTDFNLYDLIKPIINSFEGKCEKKHIVIDLFLGSKDYVVNGDKEKIEQVVYNLLDNAIKFSQNSSTVTVTINDKNDKIFISIKDTGIGIPKDSLDKIWDRFYKTDLSRGKDKTGTGLGLSIVKEILVAHGENINVISTEGAGTEFIFTLKKSKN